VEEEEDCTGCGAVEEMAVEDCAGPGVPVEEEEMPGAGPVEEELELELGTTGGMGGVYGCVFGVYDTKFH